MTANSNLNSKKVGSFAELEKNSMSTKRKRLSRKADLVIFCQPELEKLHIFAEFKLEKIKLISDVWQGKNMNILRNKIGISILM